METTTFSTFIVIRTYITMLPITTIFCNLTSLRFCPSFLIIPFINIEPFIPKFKMKSRTFSCLCWLLGLLLRYLPIVYLRKGDMDESRRGLNSREDTRFSRYFMRWIRIRFSHFKFHKSGLKCRNRIFLGISNILLKAYSILVCEKVFGRSEIVDLNISRTVEKTTTTGTSQSNYGYSVLIHFFRLFDYSCFGSGITEKISSVRPFALFFRNTVVNVAYSKPPLLSQRIFFNRNWISFHKILKQFFWIVASESFNFFDFLPKI
mmetsp:Transcript_34158/g.61593  ORF Transcript_34158/g.61593 Transcript_34158/m.61593 type:complete len:263 (-) Transcript_34158:249-1037(-)